jgi:arsenate reductase
MNKKRVLILCTGNSCRSQIAEGLVNALWGDHWRGFSAGTKPGVVNPHAIQVMSESGIDISPYKSKHISEFDGQIFDLLITVCDSANDECPYFPGARRRVHCPVPDPADFSHLADDEALPHFREARDLLREKLGVLLG